MAIRLINYVNNQLSSPALYTGIFSTRPAAGIFGRLFMSIDTKQIFQDLSSGWQVIADAGAGSGSLESVTANGNSTSYGISILANNLSLTSASSSFNYKAIDTGSILFSADASGFISQDNANFFWDNTSKRLGIGTATPGAKLDIHSGSGTTAIFNGTGVTNSVATFQSAGTSKWSLGNYVSSSVANDFVVYDNVNTTPRFLVHNTGVINIPSSLIIGSTTPTSSYTFDVTGSGNFSSSLLVGTTITANSFIPNGATVPTNGMYLSAANTLAFATNSTNRFTITSIGKIQTSTSIAGDVLFNIVNSSSTGSGLNISAASSSSNYALRVETYNGASSLLYVRGDGNVLINDTSANSYAKLQITATSGVVLGLANTSTATANGGNVIQFWGDSGYTTMGEIDLLWNAAAITDAYMAFKTRGGGTLSEKMRILSNGNLLIGSFIDQGSWKAQVTGNMFIRGSVATSAASALYIDNSSGTELFLVRNDGFFRTGTAAVSPYNYTSAAAANGYIDTDGALRRSTSSLKYKTDVRDYDKGLNQVLQMRSVYYKGINDGEKQFAGLIAEEIHDLGMTEFVQYAEDGTPDALAYSNMIALLTKAVQELNEKLVRNNIN
jgi:hypothetical protein